MARKCPLCGSRKWRKDGVTGSVVCEDGHVLQGVMSEMHVAGEPTGHALQRRRPTRGPRENKRRLYGRADANFLHGEEAEFLRLQGLQLLLRYQVQALKRLWDLPEVYEAIVRDLWTYQLVVTPPLTTPRSWKPKPGARPKAAPQPDGGSEGSGSETEKVGEGSEGSEGSEDEDEDGDEEDDSDKSDWEEEKLDSDDDLSDDETLLRDKSPGVSTPDSGDSSPSTWKRRRPIQVSDVLVCLIVGLWITRTPFTYKDVETLVNTNQIPYIDFGKTTLVPDNMKASMDLYVRLSLRPQRSPSPHTLWRFTREFAGILFIRFGQSIPEINVPPVAWQVISQLGGNAVTYDQVLAFLHLIDTNMGLVYSNVTTAVRKRRNSDSVTTIKFPTRWHDLAMPELSIAAGWVVVMKLSYGLDGEERLPLVATDPLIGMPRGDLYLQELERRLASGEMKGNCTQLEQQLFDTMDGEDIDRFLDQCEDVLLKNRDHGTGGNAFPLPSVRRTEPPLPPPNSWVAFHNEATRNPTPRAPPIPASTRNSELPLMPGDNTSTYVGVDDISVLPHDLQVVMRAAADVVGVDPVQVAALVEIFERRMENVRPKKRNTTIDRLKTAGLRESRSSTSISTSVSPEL